MMSLGLSSSSLLEVWEQGTGRHPIDQALLVLRHAYPETSYESLVQLPIGQRDTFLLKVRRATFGDGMEAAIDCPVCMERLEFALSCDALVDNASEERQPSRTIECEGVEFHIRCPDSRDIAKAAFCHDVSEAKQTLFARCITSAGATECAFQELSSSVQLTLTDELGALDSQAEMLMNLSCPACEHRWQGLFDIVPFLWGEIQVKAQRLIQEIDVLARTYGWAEADILQMSNVRRACYREMALS